MAESDQKKPAETAAQPGMTRRSFVTTAAAAGAGVVIVPRHVLGRGFQAPSDTVNIAVVGIGGMGGSNARALMSQNIVAICDVDDSYAEKQLDAVQDDAEPAGVRVRQIGGTSHARQVHGRSDRRQPAPRPPRTRWRTSSDSSTSSCRRSSATTTTARCSTSRRTSTAIIVATPDHMHAIDRVGRDGSRQARLRAEAAVLVGAGSAAPRAEGEDDEGRDADGQPGALAGRRAARLRVHHRPAPSATCARSTSGRTVRSATGRRAFRARRAPPADRRAAAGTDRGVDARLAAALAGNYPVPDRLAWDLFLGVAPHGRLSPDLSPVQLARLGGLGPGRARRHGRAPDRSSVLGARTSACRRRSRRSRRRSTASAIRTRRRPTTSSRRAATCRR